MQDLKICLYLDDVRTPTSHLPGYHPWVVVRDYDQFVNYVTEHGIPDLISFDHDLAQEHMNDYYNQVRQYGFQTPAYADYKEKTGLSCAMWLVQYCQDNNLVPKACAVHSHNPVGSDNIQGCINSFKKHLGLSQDCYKGKQPFIIETQTKPL